MAIYKNVDRKPVDVEEGYTIEVGGQRNIDPNSPHNAALIAAKSLKVIDASLPPAIAAAQTPAVAAGLSQLLVTGNSYAEMPAGRAKSRFPLEAAMMLGCPEFSYARYGAVLYQHTDPAGWRATLRRVRPWREDGITERIPTEAGDWAGNAGGDCAVLCRNLNDQVLLGLANLDIFIETLRTEVCRMRTQVWYPVTDGGWTWGTSVSSQQSDVGASDGPTRVLGSTGINAQSFASRATPAHFPGGMCHVVMGNGATGIVGGDYKIEVDGVTVAQTAYPSRFAALATYVFPTTTRFYVPAGAHTIKITMTGANGASAPGSFMGLGVEANDPGLVVLVHSWELNPAAVAILGVNSDPTVTRALNALQRALAAEFTDGLVRCWDMNTVAVGHPEVFDATDNFHPSDLGGHALGADLATFIAQHLPLKRRRKADKWLNIDTSDGFYTGAAIGSGVVQVTAGNSIGGQFRRDAEGNVELRGALQKTADPGAGAAVLLCTLPEVVRPPGSQLFVCSATDGTTRGTCQVLTSSDGTVYAVPPTAGTKIQFGAASNISLSGISFKASR